MKKSSFFRYLIAVVIATSVISCQSVQEETSTIVQKPSSAKLVAGCNLYALSLSGYSGTPVSAGLQSYIHKVDPCTGEISTVVEIKESGVTSVTSVTGLSNMIGSTTGAWGTTGKNSNFPTKILKIDVTTGFAGVGPTTVLNTLGGTKINLQDLENNGKGYFAIIEGTSKIVSVDVGTGVCKPFASAPTNQLNGLTFAGSTMYVISGITASNCLGFSGDIWAFNSLASPTAPVLATRTYNNLPANANWTMKELGFHFDVCCGFKKFIVGSAGMPSVMSYNSAISCGGVTPTFMNYIKPTYDYMLN
ncbi:MAG: hypothetical protein KA313_04260 [Pseudarcicella sp.]|nr:hypothetical protein [Pseudarcicella sp.]MBP6410291.1 hypothetical protein [Pseudarcicella sp.]